MTDVCIVTQSHPSMNPRMVKGWLMSGSPSRDDGLSRITSVT